MKFSEAVKSCLQKFFDFSGRASRSEFWWFLLFISIVHTIFYNWYNQQPGSVSFHFGFNLVLNTEAPWWANIYTAFFTLPFVSVLVRRAHDVNIDGSKLFIVPFIVFATFILLLKLVPTQSVYSTLIVVAGAGLVIAFFYLTLRKSDPGANRFGPNPHEVPS